MPVRERRVRRACQANPHVVEQIDDRPYALRRRRRRSGGHPHDAGAPAHSADDQLQRPGSRDPARRRPERRARRPKAARDLEFVGLRRSECVAGDGAGAGLLSAPAGPRRAFCPGGGRGLGSAIARALAGDGHDVTFTYRSATNEADALVKELSGAHPAQKFAARALDLADKAAIERFAGEIGSEAPFSVFVHNAGQSYDALAVMMDQAKAEAAMQVNFWSFTSLAAKLVRQMMRAKDGRVVVIGSVTAERGNQGNAAYAASKAALLGYSRTLAIESASRGITVNYVAPGFIDTEMMAKYGKYRESMEQQIPARRFPAPDHIAGIVAFLLTPQASYITGAYLPVDGGLTAAVGIHR